MGDYQTLVKEQEEISERIKTVQKNTKKDGKDRKTAKEYFEKRLAEIKLSWDQFKANDAKLQAFFEQTKEEPYWKFREEIHNMKTEFQTHLEQEIQKLGAAPKPQPNPAPDPDHPMPFNVMPRHNTAALIQKQRIRAKELLRNIKTIKDDTQAYIKTKSYYNQKIRYLTHKWENISNLHEDIIDEDTDQIYSDDFEYWESEFFEITQAMEEEIEKLEKNNNLQEVQRMQPKNQTPAITIPTFNGNYLQWTTFRDIFSQVVHNNQEMGNATKMHHLKTHVVDQAADLLKHFTTSEDNYKTSWETLNARYNNKRILVSSHIKRLLNFGIIQNEASSPIRKLVDTAKESLQCVKNLGINTDAWGPLVLELLLPKLDTETHKLYEQSLDDPKEIPTLEHLFTFLEKRFQSLELIKEYKNKRDGLSKDFKPHHASQPTSKFQHQRKSLQGYHTQVSIQCRYCKREHFIAECQNFNNMSAKARVDFVSKVELCKVCLRHYTDTKCTSKNNCKICSNNHHTMLHQREIIAALTKNEENVLLATALVKILASDGHFELCRALIDPCAQGTFITEAAVQQLRLRKYKSAVSVSGIANAKSGPSQHKVYLMIKPRYTSAFTLNAEAQVMSVISVDLPQTTIQKLEIDNNKILADPTYYNSGPIDILIGANYYGEIILPGIITNKNKWFAQQTNLGWTISGPSSTSKSHEIINMMVHVDLSEQLNRFWEIEEIDPKKQFTIEEEKCEELYKNCTKRLANGCYEVKIPLKEEGILGDSKKQAMARLIQVEKRLERNPKLKQDYHAFMDEYLQLGHMIPANTSENQLVKNYLPHHAVIKESSSTTKVRVVFDASMKTTSGLSLNDLQLIGPTLQQDLFSIVLRWRNYKYVFTADIEKMYRQIKIAEEHQDLQRILWRDEPSEPVKEYKLTTITYGTASAPYLATKTLQQLANDEKDSFQPKTIETLKEQFYIDDVLSGSNNLKDAVRLQQELIELLKRGGFNLRKWSSNSNEILENIPNDCREIKNLEIKDSTTIKTLGIYWSPLSDTFSFKTTENTDSKKPNTKRRVLSNIAKIFDPLGWLAPVTVSAKILMQKIWLTGIDWDEEIPQNLNDYWKKFEQQLPSIQNIKIPRWINFDGSGKIELHGFCDASEDAYSAVIYSKAIDVNGTIHITLLTAKTRVAPLKKISLPRLELCGATLLAKLIKYVQQALMLESKIFAYTDSTITLAWIQGHPNKWKTFVGNRVTEIQNAIPAKNWAHVKSEDNPADCASRGVSPEEIQQHQLWWSGPVWLKTICTENTSLKQFETEQDLKKIKLATFITTSYENEFLNKYSSFNKLVRITAYVKRFISNSMKKVDKLTGPLKTSELWESRKTVVKILQEISFPDELKNLRKGQTLPTRNTLLQLNPFIDEEGIMRVGGRLKHSLLMYETKHPIILPKHHHVTKLIIEDAHARTLHGGTQLTLSYIRKNFWIINAKDITRQVIHKCMRCFRYRAKESEQLMGNLPIPRVTPSRPFTHTGIDYAGPIHLRTSKGRGQRTHKGYIALFVCLATKAIHIEIVSDLTTQTFIAALKRFTARRGCCRHIYSDCGTNFKGANKELKDDFKKFNKECMPEILNIINNDGITFHFNAPASPQQGGLWEAGVKSTKYHLRRILGETSLTYEEMSTTLAQIEACLNSRPICPISSDINDIEALTPGHFLVGEPLVVPPEPSITEEAMTITKRWKRIQKLYQDFWKRWSLEYLVSLQQRMKWKKQMPNVKIGDIVMIKDNNLPPTQWLLARISETHPGTDGHTRVVTLKCNGNKSMQRPIHKICVLPIDDNMISKTNNIENEKITDDIQDDITKDEPKQRKSPRLAKVAMILFLAMTCMIGITNVNANEPYTIKQYDDSPGLYFQEIGNLHFSTNEWNIIVYINMSSYWDQLNNFRSCVQHLTKLANSSNSTKDIQNYISEIKLLKHALEEIEQRNLLIVNSNHRMKRDAPLPFIGNLLNDLFGVLDEKSAKDFNDKINQLSTNEEHLVDMIKTQTSIADTTTNILRNQQAEIVEHWKEFTHENEIIQSKLTDATTFFSLVTLSNTLMTNFQRTQDILLDALLDSKVRKVSPNLILPDQLRQELEKIHPHLPDGVTLPIGNNPEELRNLYHIMICEGRLLENLAIFKISLPLLDIERFNIYKPFPLPVTRENKMIYIQPQMDYMVINAHKDHYYYLTEQDFGSCIQAQNLEYICYLKNPIYRNSNVGDTTCELMILQSLPTNESVCKLVKEPPTEKWIHMNNNTWIYTLQAERTLTIVCGRYQKTIKIHKTGILQMDCQCIAKSSTMILRATTKYTTKVKGILLPRVNLTEYTPSTTIKTATQANQIQSNLEHLQNQINDQRAKENSIKLTGHDIHQYTIGYTTLAILALVIIIYGIKHQRKQRHDILHQHTGSTTNSNSDRPKQLV